MTLILSGTNGVSDVDGTAATPAVRGSDTNTGIFFPAADTIAFAEGGVESARFDASGNLGIGTSSPNYRLDVAGTANATALGTTLAYGISGEVYSAFRFNNSSFAGGNSEIRNIVNGAASTGSALAFFTTQTGSGPLTERARIDSSGNFMMGTTTADGRLAVRRATNGGAIASFGVTGTSFAAFYAGSAGAGAGGNGAETALYINATNGTSRSINAGGTINASGADYAEYMTKAGDFAVAKGDVVGINADGKLTNVFADAVSFVVKSTDPSYVGGDVWGNEDAIGKRPADEATDEEKAAYADALEAARQKVDRIAFAGQVPVNVMDATPGQYIVPVDDNGAIKGIAKNEADMTLADYMKAVGKVISVKDDGRAFIIVKVA